MLTGLPKDIQSAVEDLIRMQVAHGAPDFDLTCRALNMNGRALRRVLDRSGLGFRGLSKRTRLDVAQELLSETDMSVCFVAEAVGYSDPFNFSRAFNNHHGILPTIVRNSVERLTGIDRSP